MYRDILKRSFSVFKLIIGQLFVAILLINTGAIAADKEAVIQERSKSSMNITINEATLVQIEDHISDVIVGNPAIADITIQNGKTFVLTGKSYGRTNLILLNKQGGIIFNKSIFVDDDHQNIVRIQRGNDRLSYTCTPNCQPTPTIGDTEQYVANNSKNLSAKLTDVKNAMALSK